MVAVSENGGALHPPCPNLTEKPGVGQQLPWLPESNWGRPVAQLGRPQHVVVHFGVGSSSVFLAQMQPQLTLVPEMQATGVAVVRLLPRVDANMAFEGL